MRITTPAEVASQAGNKYLGVLVAAKFARYLNEFPKDQLAGQGEKLTTQALQSLVEGELNYKLRPPPPLRGVTVWAGRHVVLGVSGGIACYKSCILARRLTEAGRAGRCGADPGGRGVRAAAHLRGAHRAPRPGLPLGAAAGRSRTSGWASRPTSSSWRPATAHLIARMAQGLADDFLTTLLLAAHRAGAARSRDERRDVRATRRRRPTWSGSRERGVSRWSGPRSARSRRARPSGPGRMSEPETILAHAARVSVRGSRAAARPPGRGDGGADARDRSIRCGWSPTARAARWATGWRRRPGSGAPTWCSSPARWRCRRRSACRCGGWRRPRSSSRRCARSCPAADVLVMAAAPADFRPSDPSDRKRAAHRRRAGDSDGADRRHPRRDPERCGSPAASSWASRWRPATRWPRAGPSWSGRTST